MKQCACLTRRGTPCPHHGNRLWNGVPVCHVHDPRGTFCRQNPGAKAFAQAARRRMFGGARNPNVCPACGQPVGETGGMDGR